MIKQLFFVLALLISVGSASLYAAPRVIPQAQASHFCQLFISKGSSLSTMSMQAHRLIQPDDSLNVEQIFVGYVLLADGWQTMRLFPHQENGTISWIGSNLCQNEILYENDGKYISQEGYDHSSARLFPIDTVLIALVGATIGKTALLKFETSTNQNVLGVRHISESGYNPMFVYYYTQFLYQKFMNIGDGGFNMASKGFVSELPMYDIGLSAQNEFAAFAEQVDKSKFVIQKSLNETQLLFDSLMQKYFG